MIGYSFIGAYFFGAILCLTGFFYWLGYNELSIPPYGGVIIVILTVVWPASIVAGVILFCGASWCNWAEGLGAKTRKKRKK